MEPTKITFSRTCLILDCVQQYLSTHCANPGTLPCISHPILRSRSWRMHSSSSYAGEGSLKSSSSSSCGHPGAGRILPTTLIKCTSRMHSSSSYAGEGSLKSSSSSSSGHPVFGRILPLRSLRPTSRSASFFCCL